MRCLVSAFLTFILLVSPARAEVLPVTAAAPASSSAETPAKQAIVIDYDTGAVLFEKNADQKMPTSSMSKVMTMYLVFDALKEGKVKLDTELPVSEKAWRMGGSKMFVEVGKTVSVEDLARGVIVQSGNDATVVLAEGISGSEETFADKMNAKAAQLGMNGSHFMNASGWPDPEHYSTARDLATLGASLIRTFPDQYHYYSETEFSYHNIKQGNRNPLLYRNIGGDGIKTGHTEEGGYGLIGSGIRDGRRVVLVVNGLPDDKARAQESARLLDWGLRAFENITIFKKDAPVDSVPVAMGQEDEVALVTNRDIVVTVPTAVKNDLKVEVIYTVPLLAPVTAGQQAGLLRVTVPRLKTLEFPLFAAKDVQEMGFFAATLEKAKMLVGGAGETATP